MSECLTHRKIEQFIVGLDSWEIEFLLHDWLLWARQEQLPPSGNWTTWLFLGGRGSGKTRAGAEWIRGLVFGRPPFSLKPIGRIGLIGATLSDVREVMIEGASGILATHSQWEKPEWRPSRGQLIWSNGAIAQTISAENPEQLRGPQFEAVWCDEFCKWRYIEETFNMLQFTLRLGDAPRQLITSTPRPLALIKKLITEKNVVMTRSSTYANAVNLASSYLSSIVTRYHGSQLGRQELEGEIIDDPKNALWQRSIIDNYRINQLSVPLTRIVVAVDPPATSGQNSSSCGIVAAGIDSQKKFYVLTDASLARATPIQWANKALRLYKRLNADCLIAEINQGGEMVAAIFANISPDIPVRSVRASRGKYLRAEPVAALYEQGRVHHVGLFPMLEDEMCDFTLDGLSTRKSPDRLDALVWAITYLMTGNNRAFPRIRTI